LHQRHQPQRTTFARVGAFPLAVHSKDAARLLTLEPCVYSAALRGAGGGGAMIEIYEVP
jgi:hypothetical protein